MNTSFKIKDKVERILKEKKGEKFTTAQIADKIIELYLDECKEKEKNSKQDDINIKAQLQAEISQNKEGLKKEKHIKISLYENRVRYYYDDSIDEEEIEKDYSEKDLYPIMKNYLESQNLYAVRINEKKSKNNKGKNGNIWLHPDIIAVEDLSKNWEKNTIDFANIYFTTRTKIYSYEIKKEIINFTNVRESYFQAVSNSTWANYGYLVAVEISDDVMGELKILSSLYGIGIIQLNTAEPTESQIIIPSKERDRLDFNIMNRLIEQNSNFRSFIAIITDFYKINDKEYLKNSFDKK
ncbi:MAG: COG2958 family protein [Rickettsiales bacterium]|nr:MAG: COG2958 family protein [Rickettsiales bacterium]